MSTPRAGDVHVSRPLTNFSTRYMQAMTAFVATNAIPNAPVAKQADKYWVFNKGDLFRNQAEKRADGTETAGMNWRLSTDAYFADVWGIHDDITDRQRSNEDDGVELEESSTEAVTMACMIRRENEFASAAMSTGVWGTDVAGTTDFTKWDAASSTPISDFRTGARVIHQNTGFRPNQAVMDRETYDALLDNEDILSRVTGGSMTDKPALIQRQLLAAMLELEAIHVMDAVQNTALEGDADAMSFIAPNGALLYYAPIGTLRRRHPTAMAQFSWTGYLGANANGIRIKNFRMENIEADRIEAQMAFDFKITGSDLGYYFNDPTG